METIGIQPVEYKVLVKPDPVDEMTRGGLFVPDTVNEKLAIAQQKGTLIAIGGKAFEDFGDPKPAIGDKILFAKYAGFMIRQDRDEYRVVNDKDVACIIIGEAKKSEVV